MSCALADPPSAKTSALAASRSLLIGAALADGRDGGLAVPDAARRSPTRLSRSAECRLGISQAWLSAAICCGTPCTLIIMTR